MRSVAICLLFMGCSSGSDDSAEETDYSRTVTTDLGNWTVSFTTDPDPVPAIDLFSVEVTIAGEGAVEGLYVDVDASMPQHNHGMNTSPVVSELGGGTYVAEGLAFHMTGDWRLVVAIDDDSTYERATFWIDCCEPPQ